MRDRTKYANTRFANPIRRTMPQKPYMSQLHKSQREGFSKSYVEGYEGQLVPVPDSGMLFFYADVVFLSNKSRHQRTSSARLKFGILVIEKVRGSGEELTQVFIARTYASSVGITVTFTISSDGSMLMTGIADIASSEKPAMTES